MGVDIVGSKQKAVALVEIPPELENKKREIAEKILAQHKNVKSVLKKVGGREGELRIGKYELLAGEEDTEVLHREYGYFLRLDPRKVYFSPREATERQRIASQVKEGETVLVMFSGIMPFGIAIAKKVRAKVYGIELNPEAHRYALENARINKVSDRVVPLLGRVEDLAKNFFGKCDRVIMPLPFGSEHFLKHGLLCLKKHGTLHFYSRGTEENPFDDAGKILEKECLQLGKKFRVLGRRKVQMYAPRRWKVCLDVEVG